MEALEPHVGARVQVDGLPGRIVAKRGGGWWEIALDADATRTLKRQRGRFIVMSEPSPAEPAPALDIAEPDAGTDDGNFDLEIAALIQQKLSELEAARPAARPTAPAPPAGSESPAPAPPRFAATAGQAYKTFLAQPAIVFERSAAYPRRTWTRPRVR